MKERENNSKQVSFFQFSFFKRKKIQVTWLSDVLFFYNFFQQLMLSILTQKLNDISNLVYYVCIMYILTIYKCCMKVILYLDFTLRKKNLPIMRGMTDRLRIPCDYITNIRHLYVSFIFSVCMEAGLNRRAEKKPVPLCGIEQQSEMNYICEETRTNCP